MTKLATMGTRSCATMSISGFKDSFGGTSFSNKIEEEEYCSDPSSYVLPEDDGMDVKSFKSSVLNPIKQELGETRDYPFSLLMERIKLDGLGKKLIMATLNQAQENLNSRYWPKKLEEHGFRKIAVTGNDWGADNHVYMRAPLEKALA